MNEMKWTHVKDKLPKESDEYIVAGKTKGEIPMRRITIAMFWKSDGFWKTSPEMDVIWWMPKPSYPSF